MKEPRLHQVAIVGRMDVIGQLSTGTNSQVRQAEGLQARSQRAIDEQSLLGVDGGNGGELDKLDLKILWVRALLKKK